MASKRSKYGRPLTDDELRELDNVAFTRPGAGVSAEESIALAATAEYLEKFSRRHGANESDPGHPRPSY